MNAPQRKPSPAEALDRALAEGDSAAAVAGPKVADLLELAYRLDASVAEVTPSAEFRTAARQRLVARMAQSPGGVRSRRVSTGDRVRLWAMRLAAGLSALGCAGLAAASASASALPGEPLYPVKQASEAVTLQLATTDSAREAILLQHAEARLDETARLVEQGRAADAAATAARYDDTLGTLAAASSSEIAESNLRTNEQRLSELLQTAPEPARPGLERALTATQRSLNPTRQAVPAARSEAAALVVTPTPEPRPTMRASDADDRRTIEPRPMRPADAGERGIGESHESAAATGAGGVGNPADTPAGDTETAVSNGEPHGSAVADGHAPPRNNAHPAPAQPDRTPPGRTTPARSQPAGRGRP